MFFLLTRNHIWLSIGLFVLILISPIVGESYHIKTGDYQEIPSQLFKYVEHLDDQVSLEELQSASWTISLSSPQAYVEGFWIKVSLLNLSDHTSFGFFTPFLSNISITKSKYYLSNKGQLKSVNTWSFDEHFFNKNRWLYFYRINVEYEEENTLYYFVQSNPYDQRFTTIEGIALINWEEGFKNILNDFIRALLLIVVMATFGMFYFIIFLGTKEKIYLLLSLLATSISFFPFISSQTGVIFFPRFILSDFRCLILIAIGIILTLFAMAFLNIKENFKRLYKLYLTYISIMAIIFGGFLIDFIIWPAKNNLDLITYPPNTNSLLYEKLLNLPLILVIVLSIYAAFSLWKKGNKSAGKYLLAFCPSSIIPFNMAFGANFYGFEVQGSITQSLLLLIFILLGFAVAQRMNDLKDLVLEQQIKLTEAYQRFVPKQLLINLDKKSILDVELGDQVEKEMTILFSDIRSFTSISEKMTPEENFEFVNTYLKMMGPLVRKNNGYIDKYIGDAIMALFDHEASHAVTTAVEMLEELRTYNQKKGNQEENLLRIGIGINTGKLILGTVGESNRMEGSVISDAVNVAARLEGLTKVYKTPLLISERTKLLLPANQFLTRQIDKVAVKGKEEPILIYEVLDGEEKEIKEGKYSTIDLLNEGLSYYQNQQFKKAKLKFEKCKKIEKNDYIAELYITRCDQLIEGRFKASDWDGVNRMDFK